MEQPPPGSDADPEPLTSGEPEGPGPAPAEPPWAEEGPADTSPALPGGPFVGGPAAPFGDAMQEEPAASFQPPTMPEPEPEPEPPALASVPDPEPPAPVGPGGWIPEDSPVFGGAATPPGEASAPLPGDEMPPPALTGLHAGDPLGAPSPPPAPAEFPAAPPAPGMPGVMPEPEAVPRVIGSVPPPGYSSSASAYGGGPVPPGAFAPPAPMPQPIGDYQLAGWGSRALALIIDGIIVSIVSLILIVIVGAVFGGLGSLGGDAGGVVGFWLGVLVAFIPVFVVSLLYMPFWMARNGGATIGKQVMKIRVIRVSGQSTDFGWSALRQVVIIQGLFGFIGGIFLLGLPLLIDYLWPLWDEENRALHDMLVQSRVVKA